MNNFLKPEGAEVMRRAFHQFKLKSIGNWTEFVKTLSIGTDGQHVLITYQYLLQTVLTLLVKDRHATDKDDNVNISKEEEQVLRYIAGGSAPPSAKQGSCYPPPPPNLFCIIGYKIGIFIINYNIFLAKWSPDFRKWKPTFL